MMLLLHQHKKLALDKKILHKIYMAIFHLSTKIISRTSGRSTVAAAAYRHRDKFHDERQGITFDYTGKSDLGQCFCALPEGCPDKYRDVEFLWNEVEKIEKRKDAQLAREVEVALPHEIDAMKYKHMLREFVEENFTSKGMIADVCIHMKKGNNHAHIMLTMRDVCEDGFLLKNREWNSKNNLFEWRQSWAQIQNKFLEIDGFSVRVDHRSYAEQGIDLIPQKKVGIGFYSQSTELERIQEHIKILTDNGNHIIENPDVALSELTKHNSTFTSYDIFKFINSHTYGEDQFRLAVSSVLASDNIVPLEKEKYTTQEIVSVESRLSQHVNHLCRSNEFRLQEHYKVQSLDGLNLDQGQEKAFSEAVNEKAISVVVGVAGSGKSYMLNAVRDSYQSAGYRVSGMALSGIATSNLYESSKINSKTVFSQLRQWEEGKLLPGKKDVIVLDEAAMVDTRNLERIVSYVDRGGAKLIAIGDIQQLQAIGAGGGLKHMMDVSGYSLMDSVRRQTIEWQKEATTLFSGGENDVKEALNLYKENHRISTGDNDRNTKIALLNDYTLGYGNDNRLIFAHKRRDVKELNIGARTLLRAKDHLGNEEIVFQREKSQIILSVNDRLVFNENNASIGVKNGTLGTVTGLGPSSDITVKLDSGKSITFDSKDYNNLDYGYAVTVHKSQGSTVDQSFIYASNGYDKHLSYVALTRHRNDAKVYYSSGPGGFKSFDQFKDTLSRDNTKDFAINYKPSLLDPIHQNRIESDKIQIMMLKTGDASKVFDPQKAEDNSELFIKYPGLALDNLTHHNSIFTERDVQLFAHRNSDSHNYESVVSSIMGCEEVIGLGNDLYTTRSLIKSEHNLFDSISTLNNESQSAVQQSNKIAALSNRYLDNSQRNVFDYLVQGNSSVKVVQGIAGTGKSYMLGAVKDAFQLEGRTVRGVALSGVAAKGLEEGSGIVSSTIHRQLFEWENGKNVLEKNSVLVVDEAGMVGTKQLDSLAQFAKNTESTLILVGDSEQLQSVSAGSPFRAIKDDVGAVTLDNVRRQNIPWQKCATLLLGEKGERYTQEAIQIYADKGNILSGNDKDSVATGMVDKWFKDYKDDPTNVVMLTSTNDDALLLNTEARTLMKKSGLIESKEFTLLDSDDKELNFSISDRVVFTRNNNSMGVQNGTVGTITGFENEVLEVQLDNGHLINFDTNNYNDIAHGYAMTIHKSQGITVDKAHVLASLQMDRHSTYVALSRHRKDVRVYYSNEEFCNNETDNEKYTSFDRLKHVLSRERGGSVIRDYMSKDRYEKLATRYEDSSSYIDKISDFKGTDKHTEYYYRLTLFNKETDDELISKDIGTILDPITSSKETKKLLREEIQSMAVESKLDLKNVGARVSRLEPKEIGLDRDTEKSIDKTIDKDRGLSI